MKLANCIGKKTIKIDSCQNLLLLRGVKNLNLNGIFCVVPISCQLSFSNFRICQTAVTDVRGFAHKK